MHWEKNHTDQVRINVILFVLSLTFYILSFLVSNKAEFFYEIGMDVKQLHHELSQGIRLSSPEMCPNQIAILIQNCFLENPNDRPDFQKIKTFIREAYESLTITAADVVDDCKKVEEVDGLAKEDGMATLQVPQDDRMKTRYLEMRRENKKRQRGTQKVNNDAQESLNPTTIAVNLRTEKGRYMSLDNVISNASMIPLHGSEAKLESTEHDDKASAMDAMLANKSQPLVSAKPIQYKRLSPGSSEMKSFFSTSAVNTMNNDLLHRSQGFLNQELDSRKITQSWNPLYMMMKSSDVQLNCYKSSEDIVSLEEMAKDGESCSVGSSGSSKPIIKESSKSTNAK